MSKANDFVNQWGVFGKTMVFYRWIILLSIILAMATTAALAVFVNRSPLVVVKECEDRHFYFPKRRAVTIEEKDVIRFSKNFIKIFYSQNSPRCLMGKGLQEKFKNLKKSRKKVLQYVGRVEVVLQEKMTQANFDLIMNIENIPIVVSKQVELQISQGAGTPCNPVGLYVNGIREKRGK